jgi:hypothetical protein
MADNAFITLHWNAEDLAGKHFGRLLTIGPLKSKNGSVVWLCQCDCGSHAKVKSWDLKSGITKSCGCLRRELGRARKTHGAVQTSEYRIWNAIKQRCSNPNVKCFPRYGGRGIKMCPEWSASFEAFIRDMGPRPSALHSVERKENSGNYDASNCYWATSDVQCRNTRRSRFVEFNGERLNLVDASSKYGLAMRTLWYRLKAGWSVEQSLLTPVKKPNNKTEPS